MLTIREHYERALHKRQVDITGKTFAYNFERTLPKHMLMYLLHLLDDWSWWSHVLWHILKIVIHHIRASKCGFDICTPPFCFFMSFTLFLTLSTVTNTHLILHSPPGRQCSTRVSNAWLWVGTSTVLKLFLTCSNRKHFFMRVSWFTVGMQILLLSSYCTFWTW